MSAVRKNKEQAKTNATFNIVMGTDDGDPNSSDRRFPDQMVNILDIR